jgi:hypothetical protein
MTYRFAFGRDARVNALLGAGHFLSHFYQLCLPPLFIAWQRAFDVSFAELGLAMAVMAGAAGRHFYTIKERSAPPLKRAVRLLTNREATHDTYWASGRPRRIQGRCARRRFRHYRRGLVVGRVPPHGGCGRKSSAHQNRHQQIAV